MRGFRTRRFSSLQLSLRAPYLLSLPSLGAIGALFCLSACQGDAPNLLEGTSQHADTHSTASVTDDSKATENKKGTTDTNNKSGDKGSGQTSSGQTGTDTDTAAMKLNPADFEPDCAKGTTKATVREYIDVLCQRAFSCCESNEAFSLFGSKIQTAVQCKDALNWLASQDKISADGLAQISRFDPSLALLVHGTNAAGSEIRGGCLAECLASQKKAGCLEDTNKKYCAPRFDAPGQSCDPIRLIRGKLKAGESCSSDLAKAGLDIQCEYGLDCIERAGKHLCVKVSTEGQLCAPNPKSVQGNCERGLFCDPKELLCKKAATLGQACDTGSQSAYLPCEASLGCAPNKTCVARCEAGAECRNKLSQTDDDLCPANLSCIPGKHPSCQTPQQADSTCDSHRDCAGDLYCDGSNKDQGIGSNTTGKCKAAKKAGADCLHNEHCVAGLHCAPGGKCTAALSKDQACEHSRQCPADAPYCAMVDVDSAGQALAKPARICSPGTQKVSTCALNDSGLRDAPRFAHLSFDAYAKAQPFFKPWMSLCQEGGCDGRDETAKCEAYAKSDGACNHTGGDKVPNCAPGQHCVAGKCKDFRKVGETCDINSSKWSASDSTYKDGFPSPICDPDHSKCFKTADMSFRCLYVGDRNSKQGFCDGKAILP